MLLLLYAISLGFLGSFHCLGMCGPLALSLPVHHFLPTKKFFSILFYNVGRLFTYSVFGLLFGIIGSRLYIAGFQQKFSLFLGILLLVYLIFSFFKLRKIPFSTESWELVGRIKNSFSFLLKKRSISSFFLLGCLNGLLPCGMVYFATSGALLSETILQGVLFMAFFAFGTFPVMMLISFFGKLFTLNFRVRLSKFVPVFVSLMAILFIVRGLNLGIPYLSPKYEKEKPLVIICHKPA